MTTDSKLVEELRAAAGLPQLKRRVRSCLRCNKSFHSDGNYNRLCEECRYQNKKVNYPIDGV